MDKSKELANAHWNYIRGVLDNTPLGDKVIEVIEFHYITAFIHGYKHGVEDTESDHTEKL